jgi:hypothetical protein
MRIWGSASSDERLAWARLERAYAAMGHAEDELAAALQDVVRQGAVGPPTGGDADRVSSAAPGRAVGEVRV